MKILNPDTHRPCSNFFRLHLASFLQSNKGTNARKVISEVYAFFVVQCAVFWRKSKHKTDVTAWHGIHFHKNKKLLCEFSKLSKLNSFNLLGYLTNTDASFHVYKVRPERTGFSMYAEYTRPQLTFLALVPWLQQLKENFTYLRV